MSESWENVYSGFDRDRCRDHAGYVLTSVRRELPEPEISPTCKRKGHDWQEVRSMWPNETRLFGCKRCAKRGMVVLRTDVLAA